MQDHTLLVPVYVESHPVSFPLLHLLMFYNDHNIVQFLTTVMDIKNCLVHASFECYFFRYKFLMELGSIIYCPPTLMPGHYCWHSVIAEAANQNLPRFCLLHVLTRRASLSWYTNPTSGFPRPCTKPHGEVLQLFGCCFQSCKDSLCIKELFAFKLPLYQGIEPLVHF